jgi:hypothetical protein
MFALIPWSFSVSAFFPLVGLGLFGRSLHAGAAPILGALFMHLVFGVVLGSTYDLDQGRSRVDEVANANGDPLHVASSSAVLPAMPAGG